MNRVVVTGIGMVSPEGISKNENWENFINGKINFTKSIYPETKFYGQVNDEFKNQLSKKDLRYMDRVTQLGIVASDEAISDSGILSEQISNSEMCICIGSAAGGMETITNEIVDSVIKGMESLSLTGIPKMLSNMIGSNIAIKHKIKGPVFTYNSACASSTIAIGEAFRKIQYGDAKLALAGGSESLIVRQTIGSFEKLHSLSRNEDLEKASVPFSKYRNGFVLSEGSAMLILEDYEHAVKRNAKIYCEIIGYAATSDATSLVVPDFDGIKNCVVKALKNANVKSSEIEFISAHGTGTFANDKVESEVIRDVFPNNPFVASTKSQLGHSMGAAGAMETAMVCQMIYNKKLIGQVNVSEEEVADECKGINLLLNKNVDYKGGKIISNTFGFGGNNSCLVYDSV